ncbi:MAG: DUF4412 domain-containing protein [Desulfobacterales bacterium]|uniref:DUF4412 domain-containing protein n=1 Tax=Candidatus Desulfaltia bathyphila TaxID=2841697 RepID=A0A8J6N625_9BACT|nr:DUF4412 domain-containing protein [Candidatus Desulfaltia bathyphila]MBL7208416.1 DUF4412 domain-containing protein [Desulfobacterales bacterium]
MDCRMQHRIISVLLAISIFLFGGIAIAQDFSADMVSTTKAGVVTGKIFVAKEKTRMETPQTTIITRIDKNIVWILMSAQRMYMEQPLKPENVVATTDKMSGEIERKLVGKETVDGKTTNKYRIVYVVADKEETIFQWIAASGLPIKSAAVDGSWTVEYKNLKTGKQPDTLFEIPAGYQKFSFGVPVMPETKAEKPVEKEEKKPSKFPLRIPKLPGKFW